MITIRFGIFIPDYEGRFTKRHRTYKTDEVNVNTSYRSSTYSADCIEAIREKYPICHIKGWMLKEDS